MASLGASSSSEKPNWAMATLCFRLLGAGETEVAGTCNGAVTVLTVDMTGWLVQPFNSMIADRNVTALSATLQSVTPLREDRALL